MVQLTRASAGEFTPDPSLLRAIASGARIPQLDELRGLALLMVVSYHSLGVLSSRNDLHGDIRVDVFLILSGFSLCIAPAPEGTWQFARRRLWRLVPSYWMALLLFLVGGHYVLRQDWGAGDIASHFLGVHGLLLNRPAYFLSINDSFWYVSILLLVYPAYYATRKVTSAVRLVALGAAGAVALALLYKLSRHDIGLWHVPLRFFSFFLGAAAARLLQFPRAAIHVSAWEVAALLALCFSAFRGLVVLAYPAAALGVCVLYCVLRGAWAGPRAGRAATGALAVVGSLSYELYLLHQPLMRDYAGHFIRVFSGTPGTANLVLGLVLGFAVCAALSVALRAASRRLQPGG
jgi:peptidoglycan/LPS O-acetylase OafA/YrhL